MWKSILVGFFIFCSVNSQPINSTKDTLSTTTPVSIIYQYETKSPDGSFNNSYQTSNGIKVENQGYVKNILVPQQADLNGKLISEHEETIIVQIGSYSYYDPEGNIISVQYIADENGFQPSGDHLPVPPFAQSNQNQQLGSNIANQPSFQNQQLGSSVVSQPSNQNQLGSNIYTRPAHQDQLEANINNRPSFYSGQYIQNPQYQAQSAGSQPNILLQRDSSEIRQRQKRQLLTQNRPIETGSSHGGDFVQHRPIEGGNEFSQNRPIETGYNDYNKNRRIEENIRHRRQLLTQNRKIETGSSHGGDFVQHRPIEGGNEFAQNRPIETGYNDYNKNRKIEETIRHRRQLLTQNRPIETGSSHGGDFVQHRPIEGGNEFSQNRPIETGYNDYNKNRRIEETIRHRRQLLTQNRPIETGSSHGGDFVQHRPIEGGNEFSQNRPIETGYNDSNKNRRIEETIRHRRQLLTQNRPIETGSSHGGDFVQHRPIEGGNEFSQNRPIETGYNDYNKNRRIEETIRHRRQLLTQNRPIETGSSHGGDFVQHRPIEGGNEFSQNKPIETGYNDYNKNRRIEETIRHRRQLLTQNRPMETGSSSGGDGFIQHRPIEGGDVQSRPIETGNNEFILNRPTVTTYKYISI